jgi:hypothetical protein
MRKVDLQEDEYRLKRLLRRLLRQPARMPRSNGALGQQGFSSGEIFSGVA